MEPEGTKRWLVQIDENRWLMYDEFDEIEEWDEVLELTLPRDMANMLDLMQSNYFHMQGYFSAQWAIMQDKLAMDAGLAEESAGEVEKPVPMSEMPNLLHEFETIIRTNNLEDIKVKPEEEDK